MIETTVFYELRCDKCDCYLYNSDTDNSIFTDLKKMLKQAKEKGWTRSKKRPFKNYCDDCNKKIINAKNSLKKGTKK